MMVKNTNAQPYSLLHKITINTNIAPKNSTDAFIKRDVPYKEQMSKPPVISVSNDENTSTDQIHPSQDETPGSVKFSVHSASTLCSTPVDPSTNLGIPTSGQLITKNMNAVPNNDKVDNQLIMTDVVAILQHLTPLSIIDDLKIHLQI
jgi:hypothetical protein